MPPGGVCAGFGFPCTSSVIFDTSELSSTLTSDAVTFDRSFCTITPAGGVFSLAMVLVISTESRSSCHEAAIGHCRCA